MFFGGRGFRPTRTESQAPAKTPPTRGTSTLELRNEDWEITAQMIGTSEVITPIVSATKTVFSRCA